MLDTDQPLIIPPLVHSWSHQDELQHLARERESMGDLDEDEDLDDDEDDDDEDLDEEDDDEEEDDPKAAKKPAEKKPLPADLREILRKNRLTSRKAVRELAEARAELAAMKKAGKKTPTRKPAAAEVDEDEIEERVSKGKAEGIKIAIRAEAKTALLAAGLQPGEGGATLKKALRLLDLDEVTLDDDGDPEGLDDQIVELRSEMPELFRVARKKRKINGEDTRDSSGKPRKKSATEIQAERLQRGKK